MTNTTKPLLVGECNPYSADPRYALYHEPPNSGGGRLCRLILGVAPKDYVRCFDRANLCGQRWSMREARTRAEQLLLTRAGPIILCGSKVSAAFGMKYEPFTIEHRPDDCATPIVILPHPSGLNRAWNNPAAFDTARGILRVAGVLPLPPWPPTPGSRPAAE